MFKIWLYSIAFFFSLVVFVGARSLGGSHLQFMGESLGLVIVLLSCQVCFHLNGVDDLLVESKPQIFLQKILKSVGLALLFAGLLFYVFPTLSPGYTASAASACSCAWARNSRGRGKSIIRWRSGCGTCSGSRSGEGRRWAEQARGDWRLATGDWRC